MADNTLFPLPQPGDYPWLTGTPAQKLTTSAILPIVAKARGYETLTPENYPDWLEKYRQGTKNSKTGVFVRDAIASQDAMFMPWYSIPSVTEANTTGISPCMDSWQLRPAIPRYTTGTGKAAKYLTAPGKPTVMDIHPATPPKTLRDTDTVIIAEGLLKADAIVSAQLNHHSIILPVTDQTTVTQAQQALQDAIKNTPGWIPVIAIAGVYNWRSNPEWNSLNLTQKQIYIAFDGDTATNLGVWQAASSLFEYLETSKHAKTVKLIQTPLTQNDQHRGVDDWIHDGALFTDILKNTTDLPQAPTLEETTSVDGLKRISPDGLRFEQGIGADDQHDAGWITIAGVGGRIVSFTNPRFPTEDEIRTGKLNAGVPIGEQTAYNPNSTVSIEVGWADESGHPTTVKIEGPSDILNHKPEEWGRWGAKIPPILYSCPDWPPKNGAEWVEAIRAHRKQEVTYIDRWTSMGWIPRKDDQPVFTIGNQIIDYTGPISLPNFVPLKEEDLDGASLFGIVDPPTIDQPIENNPDYQTQILDDFRRVYAGMFQSGAWTDLRLPVLMIALALRPICPIPTRLASYFVGSKGSGKSWSAAAIMGFWQHTAGTWTNSRLPGGASDTAASMEHAIARVPIWVADDLAPSVSKMRAETTESGIGEIIRNVHDHRGRRRMNPDGSARVVNTPRALLVVTGENDFTTTSVSDRVLIVRFGKESLVVKDEEGLEVGSLAPVEALTKDEPVLARISGYCIQNYCDIARQVGWAELYKQCQTFSERALKFFKTKFFAQVQGKDGLGTRKLEMVRELFLGLYMLELLLYRAGADKDKVLGPVLRENLSGPEGDGKAWYGDVFSYVLGDVEESAERMPGLSLLEGLRGVLASGAAHLADPDHPGEPPLGGTAKDAGVGWVRDAARDTYMPKGETIGWIVNNNGAQVAVFNMRGSFNLVQRKFPDLLPPGTKQATTWSAFWAEHLAYDVRQRRRNTSGNFRNDIQYETGEGGSVSGVPILVDELLYGKQGSVQD